MSKAIPQDEEIMATDRFRVVRRYHRLDSGKVVSREVIQHRGAVVILPLVDDDRVCLIRNHRVAVGQTLIELPAGTIDEGEIPAECARRELIEETGYRAGKLEKGCQFYMSPGILNEQMHFFIASELTKGKAELEETEEIELLVAPWAEALLMAERGEIEDSKTLAALLWYECFRRRGAERS